MKESRQQLYQRLHKIKGLCVLCPKRRCNESKLYCGEHRIKRNKYFNKIYKNNKQYWKKYYRSNQIMAEYVVVAFGLDRYLGYINNIKKRGSETILTTFKPFLIPIYFMHMRRYEKRI